MVFFKYIQTLNQVVKGTKSRIVKDLDVKYIVNVIMEYALSNTDFIKRMLEGQNLKVMEL